MNPAIQEVRYCLYARKSSEQDERQAMSIDSQIKEMRAMAERDGLSIVDFKQESFSAKESGKRQEFDTGMVRDQQDGKPRYDLIPVGPLKRLADLYARGAIKYDEYNWAKGQPYSRAYASLLRHIYAWREGETEEDHLAAVVFNAFALMYYEDNKPELNDLDSK